MMNAPPEIRQLVERFQLHREAYRSAHYNETQVRREFVDPFFKALGWDVDNEQGYAEAYKDVIHEDALKFGGSTKAPDYCFRIGGVRKYFVETKRPSVNLKTDPEPAYQLRRYAWSAKLPLSILTDFEEFSVYNCRVRPRKTHKASKERVLYITFDQYLDRWDEIAGIFSREAILRGAFDKYAESKKKRGTAEVDEAFLKEIEGWREVLARNLALRNPGLSQRELNYAVQKTIDRIIFLRICEDRGIEPADRLRGVTNGPNLYPRLCEVFRAADDRYNSGLFHFQSEKGRPEDADEWTLALAVDDKPLKEIITGLYYPDSPYEFSVLPADILGQVYEQFLGKVIRLTKGHQARVEEKPEVRKAGGVYYTPTYIVDYIVENTVGKLLEGKTAYDVAARTKAWRPAKQGRPLAVLDPACGSGSFLIGAYQYLLDWYRDWYAANDPDHWLRLKEPTICETVPNLPSPSGRGAGGEGLAHDSTANYRLATSEKKRILLDHIFGVDIDAQAVEVTKLSLLLKVLEGETRETLQRQLFARQRALPDLGANIKCGNSLIGPDFYAGRQLGMFDEEERYRINAFDWQREFPETMRAGGFDVVIGNPPYVRIHNLVDFYPDEIRHIQSTYATAAFGKVDLYIPFVQRSTSMLGTGGVLGFIVPNKFMQSDYGVNLRKLIVEEKLLHSIVDFRALQVFEGATTYTCLLFLHNSRHSTFRAVLQTNEDHPENVLADGREAEFSICSISDKPWDLSYPEHVALINKLERTSIPLGKIAHEMITGVKTGANDVFVIELSTTSDDLVQLIETTEHTLLRPYLKSENLRRYRVTPAARVLIYPYSLTDGATRLIPETELRRNSHLVWEHLQAHKKKLENRQKGKLKGANWYGLSFASSLTMFDSRKIVTPTLAPTNRFAFDESGVMFPQGAGGGMGIVIDQPYSPMYMLALLNSRLLTFFFQRISSCFQGGWFAYEPRYVRRIPIRQIDFEDAEEVAEHNCIATLGDGMVKLHRQLPKARTGHEQTALRRQIESTDAEIDRLVYNLYGLTEDEIRMVEEAGAR